MKKEYRILINGIEQRGFSLVKESFDGALDLVREWKAQNRLPDGVRIVIRTIIYTDEEVTL